MAKLLEEDEEDFSFLDDIGDIIQSYIDLEDDKPGGSGPAVVGGKREELLAKRNRLQREIEQLENILAADSIPDDILTVLGEDSDSSDEDSDDVELENRQKIEACLQVNLQYQEVLKDKLNKLEMLLSDNRQKQREIMASCSSSPGPSFLGHFMQPYFKDKLTGLGPPANEETKQRMSHSTRSIEEQKTTWEDWQKALLTNAVATDTKTRMLNPKLCKLEYLTRKMSTAEDEEKEALKTKMDLTEKDIADIRAMSEEQLLAGGCNDHHDWEKISNIDFEGSRRPEDLKKFWQSYLHPSINKTAWEQEEIDKLGKIVKDFNCCHWDKIAEALGTNRTAFMCFQIYQRYISGNLWKRKRWTEEEDQTLRGLVEKMRIGNCIPYMQMSYFMEGRTASQMSRRWRFFLDPSINRGPWSEEEDQLLLNAVAKSGIKKWAKVRVEVPGRTAVACRVRYNQYGTKVQKMERTTGV